ncbi:hypothetical protein [Endozoicomonas euniceicola]|uniref:Uncharacterized protein n=1 Tax=Endozoicomonas euniceicola TaxID=1234143 RepID=A0ABY6GUK5_9GAMM|nr:hypothetical protein [Endozoicomonas euniceicola]UYM16445.1 hypothetical protein NX720_00480 [Endozoicomonas euniceicola]
MNPVVNIGNTGAIAGQNPVNSDDTGSGFVSDKCEQGNAHDTPRLFVDTPVLSRKINHIGEFEATLSELQQRADYYSEKRQIARVRINLDKDNDSLFAEIRPEAERLYGSQAHLFYPDPPSISLMKDFLKTSQQINMLSRDINSFFKTLASRKLAVHELLKTKKSETGVASTDSEKTVNAQKRPLIDSSDTEMPPRKVKKK